MLAVDGVGLFLAVFADKHKGKTRSTKPDGLGLVLPNKFVVGMGMDVCGYWRNLPGISTLESES